MLKIRAAHRAGSMRILLWSLSAKAVLPNDYLARSTPMLYLRTALECNAKHVWVLQDGCCTACVQTGLAGAACVLYFCRAVGWVGFASVDPQLECRLCQLLSHALDVCPPSRSQAALLAAAQVASIPPAHAGTSLPPTVTSANRTAAACIPRAASRTRCDACQRPSTTNRSTT